MKNKVRDKKYCGVDEQKIMSASPSLNWDNLGHLFEFIVERYNIHYKKDCLGLKKPWTTNKILQNYRFTNVHRIHDKQTRYLIENISKNQNLTLEDKIVNTFLFRAWNNLETFKIFGGPWKAQDLYLNNIKEYARKRYLETTDRLTRLWWSNAYNQGGTKMSWAYLDEDGYRTKVGFEENIVLRPFHVPVWMNKKMIANRLLNAKDQQECFEIIKELKGFAEFLAYQVFVDLTYIDDFPFSENEFVVAGPGCKRGLDYIFKDRDGLTYEEALFWLRNEFNAIMLSIGDWDPIELFKDLPLHDRYMNIMSLENCMCEISKYIRLVNGEGRPRNKYEGV